MSDRTTSTAGREACTALCDIPRSSDGEATVVIRYTRDWMPIVIVE